MRSLKALIRACRHVPVTSLCLATTLSLFVAVEVDQARLGIDDAAAMARWGAVAHDPTVSGPVQLWEGQWWRMLVGAFHHMGWIHLVSNVLGIWVLGLTLESRMRWWTYASFLLLAALISVLPVYLDGQYAVGLSGMAYAMFGMALVLRRKDAEVAAWFTWPFVLIGLAWLVVCVVLTRLEIVPVANAAHLVGLLYGWIIGQVTFGTWGEHRLRKTCVLAAHLAILPAVWIIVHPQHNARYHWYLAMKSDDAETRRRHLEKAVHCRPEWGPAWWQLALCEERLGRPLAAWTTVLEGLKRSPQSQIGRNLATLLWWRLPSAELRREARSAFEQVFGDDADHWRRRLRLPAEDVALADDRRPAGNRGDTKPFPPVRSFTGHDPRSPGPTGVHRRSLKAPPVDPESPASAVEGVLL